MTRRRLDIEPALAAIVARVSAATGISARQIRSGRRGSRPTVRARQIATYLAVVILEFSREDVGRYFRRHRTTTGHAVRVIEDLREDPVLDGLITRLEAKAPSNMRPTRP